MSKVELIYVTPDVERVIEEAGRTAYKSDDKISNGSAAKFIKSIIKSGHESVLEHGVASFRISGFSRISSQQLTRHRIASFTQRSQRYVKEGQFEFIVPPSIMANEEARDEFICAMEFIQVMYDAMVNEYGIKKEDARFLLPNACETELVMTCNFREWRHFLKLRLSRHSQWEIRQLAQKILALLVYCAPNVFDDLTGGANE